MSGYLAGIKFAEQALLNTYTENSYTINLKTDSQLKTFQQGMQDYFEYVGETLGVDLKSIQESVMIDEG